MNTNYAEQFDVHDLIVDPITYEDLVLMVKNINPQKFRLDARLRYEFAAVLEAQMEEALELLEDHMQDIFDCAFSSQETA